MFSTADIRESTYGSAYRRGKEIYETGGVFDFSYELYLEHELPMAELSARVRGNMQEYYHVSASVDEEFADVASCHCECEAFYNYDGSCKHCVAVLFAYVNRREAAELLRIKKGKEQAVGAAELQTPKALKRLLGHYAANADVSYLIPQSVYEKVELLPYFQLRYGYATVEFKIGIEQKYVLKNISAFLHAIEQKEKVHYGKKLDFYHSREAFTKEAWRLIEFLQAQEEDKRRRSKYHAYYVYEASYERVMELDEVAIDRFFEAVGDGEFYGELGNNEQMLCHFALEEKKPKLTIRMGAAGIFLQLEELSVIRGSRRYYFYQEETIFRAPVGLKGEVGEFFDYIERQADGACYLAAQELPAFCRDLLPLLRENFCVSAEGFDESLYIPKKPEFELYLDKQDNQVIGAKLLAVYGDKKYNVLKRPEEGEVRELAEELRVRSLVEPYFNGFGMGDTVFVLSHDEELLYELLTGGLQRLSAYMAIYTSEEFRGLRVIAPPAVSVGVALKSDLLELTLSSKEMKPEELAYLLTKYDRKKKYIRLKNGEFLELGDDGIGLLAELRETLHLTEAKLKSGCVQIPKYRAMYLDAALKSSQKLSVEKNREFKGIVRNMKTIEDSDYEVPETLKTIMRSYQKTGFLWLKTLRENGFGGILADDMGLGKTLQVISLLLSEQEGSEGGAHGQRRSLIVCPASLVYNWKKELERFAPQLSARVIVGLAAERARLVAQSAEGEILITSYDLLKRDAHLYQDMVFAIQVIDEAQYIKNPGTQAAKGVKGISAAFKLALTGTPIENRLSELWSIFDYLMPGFLYTYQRFRQEMELPIVTSSDEDKMKRLQRMIRPFVLRRLKSEVLSDLPEKLEENVYARLEGEQRALYDAYAQRMKELLSEKSDKEFRTEKLQILSELTKLRQLCCDPSLLFEGYQGGSAKLEMCMELLLNAVQGGHKILLFSQFTSMLDRLGERLKSEGVRYYMLTGAVGKEQRMQMVESFAQDDVSVFCISLKAGGTGLNLTAADIVIHYDPWWNVAVQNQATDRAHRIGQKNVVTVYRLVSEGTIEEKILAMQERKRQLAEQVLNGDGMDSASFTREELLELLG